LFSTSIPIPRGEAGGKRSSAGGERDAAKIREASVVLPARFSLDLLSLTPTTSFLDLGPSPPTALSLFLLSKRNNMLSDDDEASTIPAQPLSPFAVAAAEGFRCGDAAEAGSDENSDNDDGAFRPRGNSRRGRRPASRLGAASSRKALLDDDSDYDDEDEEEQERRRARAAAFALTPSKVSGLRGLVAI
jgi:hypothetical protein